MNEQSAHSVYIPVMGTGFTLDTPLLVGKFGISSVVSLVDDHLIEKMREYYCGVFNKPYTPILNGDEDPRARRITAYLDMTDEILAGQIAQMKTEPLSPGTDAYTYFDLLPDTSELKAQFNRYLSCQNPDERTLMEDLLRAQIRPGSINANIMTKVDRDNFRGSERLSPEFSDASAALRGFARSTVNSSIVFSAGLNKRLYSYIEQFNDFFPDTEGQTAKKVIIKVSDYRSAQTQGKLLARRGIWVSEFRIESGMNCGGHTFPTKGLLLGPVLQEFKEKREQLYSELMALYQNGLKERNAANLSSRPPMRITVQGGISTAAEHAFLLDHYELDAAGWGTPFLLVPQATSVDQEMLTKLAACTEEDVQVSNASPLNVLFQNLRTSASEMARRLRISHDKPGSTCPKGFLFFNTEFSERPVCTASRFYQQHKIEALKAQDLTPEAFEFEKGLITDKACICHDLGVSPLIKHGIETAGNSTPAVCPSPNIAYFTREYTFAEMMNHIYGRINLLEKINHASLFATELKLYFNYLKNMAQKTLTDLNEKEIPYISVFHENLVKGIEYYQRLKSEMVQFSESYLDRFSKDISYYTQRLEELMQQLNATFPGKMAAVAG